MIGKALSIPLGKELKDGQIQSIRDTLGVLRHGAIAGVGTAKGVLLADEMGTGKTVVAVVTANTERYRRILVICPANTREATWIKEIREWQTLDHLVVAITARSQYRSDFISSLTSGWVIINYDILGRHPEIKESQWDLVICDECHLLKNPIAKRTCEVFGGKYRGTPIPPIPTAKTLLLSGTPLLNRPDELYTQLSYLDPGNWPTFKGFVNTYYEADAEIDDQLRVTGTPSNLDQLQRKLRATIMVRQMKADVLDLPPKTYETRWVDHSQLPPQLGVWFHDMRRQITITHKKMQKADPNEEKQEYRERLNELLESVRYEVGVAKLDEVLRYLMLRTEKTLVFAYHREIIDGLEVALSNAGRQVVTLTGRTRDPVATVMRFQEDRNCTFFIGNIRAAGVGITLTAASHVVFAELDWTPALHQQAEDRAHRIGQTKEVTIVYFVLDDDISTDGQIYRLLEAKQVISRQALNRILVAETRG
jgi:SWI/SNF-related matrix-associated actin-dependent regulator 1 of chromatin subfamily A